MFRIQLVTISVSPIWLKQLLRNWHSTVALNLFPLFFLFMHSTHFSSIHISDSSDSDLWIHSTIRNANILCFFTLHKLSFVICLKKIYMDATLLSIVKKDSYTSNYDPLPVFVFITIHCDHGNRLFWRSHYYRNGLLTKTDLLTGWKAAKLILALKKVIIIRLNFNFIYLHIPPLVSNWFPSTNYKLQVPSQARLAQDNRK